MTNMEVRGPAGLPPTWPAEATRMQVEAIIRDRPQEAEYAARGFIYHIAPRHFQPAPGEYVLDTLKRQNVEAYWREVAHLVSQFSMFRSVLSRDSVRANKMNQMFGVEFEARMMQRRWGTASEAEKRRIRAELEPLMARHFEVSMELREMEMRDIERRLAEARQETQNRLRRRDDHIRWAVEDIIRDAERGLPD